MHPYHTSAGRGGSPQLVTGSDAAHYRHYFFRSYARHVLFWAGRALTLTYEKLVASDSMQLKLRFCC